MKILVVDDSPVDRQILSAYCRKNGYNVVTAGNGLEAVEAFSSQPPDMVLMDVTMPEMDGFEATARIKAWCQESDSPWIPIILITGLQDDSDLVRGVESGADDYLTKPVNLTILGEKIKVMQRISQIQQALGESLEELKKYRDQAEDEFHSARRVMDKMLNLSYLDQDRVQRWIMPTNDFSGDLIAAAQSQGSKQYVLLADASGHGLPAALIVLQIARTFYSMAERGCSVQSILEELNWRIHSQLPTGHFVAATLISMDPYRQCIEAWNGGNPPILLVSPQGKILHRWDSLNLPLGILSKEDFGTQPTSFKCREESQLLMCSDGLLEAENVHGRAFGKERMLQVLGSTHSKNRFTALKDAVQAHLGGQEAHDDVSLVAIQYEPDQSREKTQPQPETGKRTPQETDQWHFRIQLGPEKLRSLDVMPLFLEWLSLMDVRKSHSSPIFIILSELYTNALEHGLLQLDSSLKLLPGGFEQYMTERTRRLVRLSQGSITVEVRQSEGKERPSLSIRVQDSGPGFDHEAVLRAPMTEEATPMGRGIPLVRSLCSEIQYSGVGNEVSVRFEL